MKQLFMLSAALLCLLTACNDDDTTTTPPAGTYSLVRVSGGLMGADWRYSPNEVIWDINAAQDSVIINNNTQRDIPVRFTSGRYTYAVRNEPGDLGFCDKSLYIGNNYFGCYSTSNDTITVNDVYADGFAYTFVKN